MLPAHPITEAGGKGQSEQVLSAWLMTSADAHHALGLTPPASCRLSFAFYNTLDDADRAVAAVADVAAGRVNQWRRRPPVSTIGG